jgi:hypothetical protein
MVIFGKRNHDSHNTIREFVSTDTYLEKHGVSQSAIEIAPHKNNLIEDFLAKHGVEEDALRTVEGRRGAELKHRLTARMILLLALLAPMVVIPFWLMWILSPINIKNYSERMQGAFLAALASDVLGLCWVVTRDLFPQGKDGSKEQDEPDENTSTEE